MYLGLKFVLVFLAFCNQWTKSTLPYEQRDVLYLLLTYLHLTVCDNFRHESVCWFILKTEQATQKERKASKLYFEEYISTTYFPAPFHYCSIFGFKSLSHGRVSEYWVSKILEMLFGTNVCCFVCITLLSFRWALGQDHVFLLLPSCLYKLLGSLWSPNCEIILYQCGLLSDTCSTYCSLLEKL